MVNTSPRNIICQCLATFTPLISLRDVIFLLARVFILLIDRATQEVPIKKYLKEIVGPIFEIYAIELLRSMSTCEAWRHLRTLLHFYPENIDLPGVCIHMFLLMKH